MNAIFHKDAEGCSQEQVCAFTWTDPKQRLSLVLPEGFQEMEEEKREEYFSMEERPEIIMEDEQGSTQFTLQFLNKAMSREETKEAVRGICELTQKTFVQYKTSPLYLYEKSEIPVGWFCMSMKALKREHIKAVFSIENRMVLLTLTYPEEERVKWQVFARYLFDSLHQEKREGGIWNR